MLGELCDSECTEEAAELEASSQAGSTAVAGGQLGSVAVAGGQAGATAVAGGQLDSVAVAGAQAGSARRSSRKRQQHALSTAISPHP
eukprot:jgi/Chrzof1/11543/UNPLg00479.t1